MSAPNPTTEMPTEAPETIPVTLPTDAHSEMSLLSLTLKHGRAVLDVSLVQGEEFFFPRYRVPFEAARRLFDEGKEISADLVHEALSAEQKTGVGGIEFLRGLEENCTPNTPQAVRVAPTYARCITDVYARRKMIHAMQKGAALAADMNQRAEEALTASAALVDEAAIPTGEDSAIAPLGSVLDGVLVEIEEGIKSEKDIPGYPSGLLAWDLAIGGLQTPSVNILAGRPGAGKTAVLITIAMNCASHGFPVIVFSLEMTKAALGKRIITNRTGVPYLRLGTRNLSRAEQAMIIREAETIRHLNLKIVDDGGLTVKKIDAKIRKFIDKHCKGVPPIVMIDYAQIIEHEEGRKNDNDTAALARVASQLQKVMKRHNAACLLLAQINRGVERREDKRPLMSDLEGSGKLEQIADSLTLLYRKAYYERGEIQEGLADDVMPQGLSPAEIALRQTQALSRAAGSVHKDGELEEAEWLIEKARNSPRQTLMMTFNPAKMSFASGSPFPKGF